MKQLRIYLLAASLATCLASSAHAQVTIIGGSTNNGNLDLTYAQEIVPGFFLPKPQIWINEGSRAITGPYEDEMSSEPWAGPAPTPVTTDGNLNPPPPDGCGGPDCAVFFKPFSGGGANGAATGHLYQDNPATPGSSYVLTGWAGAEANVLVAGAEIALEFLDAGNVVIPASGQIIDLLPTLTVPNGEPFTYKLYMAMAVAPVGAVTVRARASFIDGTANPAGGGQAFVVDDFTLTDEGVPITISGQAFDDLDGNGVKEPGDGGLPGVTIELDFGANGTVDATTPTDAGGNYSFPNLGPGTYRVRQVTPAGRVQTTANPADIVASGTDVTGIDFGSFALITISGQAFNDVNGNGVKEPGDGGLPGVTIELDFDANGTVDATTPTDGSGNYSFASLGPGTYRVRQVVPVGRVQTTADPADIVASSGTDVTGIDFGSRLISPIEIPTLDPRALAVSALLLVAVATWVLRRR